MRLSRRPGRARRALWTRLAAALAAVLALAGATVAGLAWYATSRLIAVTHVRDTYPLRIMAVGRGRASVTLSSGRDAAEPGSFRLAWPGGHAIAGPVTRIGAGSVTRRLSGISGHLAVGERAGIEPGAYTGNPQTALGIPFRAVDVPTPLGGMPAWLIRGRRAAWIILIHGLGGSRADTLPVMPDLRALGYPMLAITFRNDAAAPASPDHQSHLGQTEWHDVGAAVGYAAAHGARGVILYGFSLGGAMALITAEHSLMRGQVRALILDSPILDWRATLNYQGRLLGWPQPIVSLGEIVLGWRTGLSYAMFDQLHRDRALRVPILLIQGMADTIVPPSLATAFARARPREVTYLPVPGADHVSAIDADPGGYREALRRFLSRLTQRS